MIEFKLPFRLSRECTRLWSTKLTSIKDNLVNFKTGIMVLWMCTWWPLTPKTLTFATLDTSGINLGSCSIRVKVWWDQEILIVLWICTWRLLIPWPWFWHLPNWTPQWLTRRHALYVCQVWWGCDQPRRYWRVSEFSLSHPWPQWPWPLRNSIPQWGYEQAKDILKVLWICTWWSKYTHLPNLVTIRGHRPERRHRNGSPILVWGWITGR
jgi:hypothetical protein